MMYTDATTIEMRAAAGDPVAARRLAEREELDRAAACRYVVTRGDRYLGTMTIPEFMALPPEETIDAELKAK